MARQFDEENRPGLRARIEEQAAERIQKKEEKVFYTNEMNIDEKVYQALRKKGVDC
jgi:Na+-translocating ferredoxin:NAD+ oxidoreductase RnfG subunit